MCLDLIVIFDVICLSANCQMRSNLLQTRALGLCSAHCASRASSGGMRRGACVLRHTGYISNRCHIFNLFTRDFRPVLHPVWATILWRRYRHLPVAGSTIDPLTRLVFAETQSPSVLGESSFRTTHSPHRFCGDAVATCTRRQQTSTGGTGAKMAVGLLLKVALPV